MTVVRATLAAVGFILAIAEVGWAARDDRFSTAPEPFGGSPVNQGHLVVNVEALAGELRSKAGRQPIRVTIENKGATPREIELQASWRGALSFPSSGERTIRTSRSLTAPPLSRTSIEMLVASHSQQTVVMDVIVDGSRLRQLSWWGRAGPFDIVAMSASLPQAIRSKAEEWAKSNNDDFGVVVVDAPNWPEDWRGLTVFRSVVLDRSDWEQAPQATRERWLDFAASGGDLVVVGLPQVPVEGPSSAGTHLWGSGTVQAASDWTPPKPVDWKSNLSSLEKQVPNVTYNTPLLLIVMLGFAAAAGPLNLFWIAPVGRRHRLFFSTPLIALGTSLLLLGVILIGDGVGGAGERRTLVTLLPYAQKSVIRQEQVVRTGLLLGSTFELPEHSVFEETGELDHRASSLMAYNVERRYSGDWFASRSKHQHAIQTLRPSRWEMVVRPGPDGPILTSTLNTVLDQVFYRDELNRFWHAETLRPGEARALKSVEPSAFERWWQAETTVAGREVAQVASTWIRRPGCVVASSSGDALAIETLKGLRWNDRAWVVGPVIRGLSLESSGDKANE